MTDGTRCVEYARNIFTKRGILRSFPPAESDINRVKGEVAKSPFIFGVIVDFDYTF
jgi:hypothetical protein